MDKKEWGMISNQILQTTIDGVKGITRADLCIIDRTGDILASTGDKIKIKQKDVDAFVESPADSQEIMGSQYFKIIEDQQVEYVLILNGNGEDIHMIGRLVTFQIQNLLIAYKERFDRDNFVKNLLLDNLLLVDIYNRAKKLHIETSARRVVLLLETEDEKDFNALEIVKNNFETKGTDFITAVDEKNVIIVKQLQSDNATPEIESAAKSILDLFPKDKAIIAYGTVIREIKEVSKSYKEARMALDVGKIFFAERNIIAYSSLGIGRLIYQLPIPLCKMFIKEIFDKKNPDEFDEETIVTINKFFENNLNVSETSRQLYIHRNTLVYRLDKLQKTTGLDLRIFEDAITFKIALMVVKYMKYMETFDY